MMRKILFLSASENVEWNDSEQLWADLATYMLNRGYNIVVNTIQAEYIAGELEVINDRGGVLTFRPNVHVNGKATDMAKNRILDYKWKSTVLDFQPDAIFISGSGKFDYALRQHGEWLFDLDKPVFLLVQNIQDLKHLDSDTKGFFNNIFSHCEKVLFVTEADKNQVVSTLSYEVNNVAVISNTVKIKETTKAGTVVENLADAIASAKAFVNV